MKHNVESVMMILHLRIHWIIICQTLNAEAKINKEQEKYIQKMNTATLLTIMSFQICMMLFFNETKGEILKNLRATLHLQSSFEEQTKISVSKY